MVISMAELWDVYDIDRIKTGKTVERGEKMSAGSYHIVVHVCIFNEKGEMLIQRRKADKKEWPGYWDVSVGGSALAGETTRDAAERETFEELGLRLDLSGRRPSLTVNFFPGFDDVYLILGDVDPSDLRLQAEEVEEVRYASKDEILKMIKEGTFIPCPESYISYIFDLKELNGIRGVIA